MEEDNGRGQDPHRIVALVKKKWSLYAKNISKESVKGR
jgi:hypothetical protein